VHVKRGAHRPNCRASHDLGAPQGRAPSYSSGTPQQSGAAAWPARLRERKRSLDTRRLRLPLNSAFEV